MQRWTDRALSVLGDVVIVLALCKVHAAYVATPPYDFTGSTRFAWALTFIALLGVCTYAAGLPDQPRSTSNAAVVAALAAGAATIGVSTIQLVVGDALLPRFVVFSTFGVSIPWQISLNALARRGQRRDGERDRVLLIAAEAERERLIEDLRMALERPARLVGSMSPLDAAGDGLAQPLVEQLTKSAATLVVIDRMAMSDDRIVAQAARLHESGIRIRPLVSFYQDWLGKLPVSELGRASLFFDIGELHRRTYTRVSRVLDIAASTIGLLALLLVTPLVAFGNLVANRGPLLYRQDRVGKGGRVFTILKFRTMREDSDTSPQDGSPGSPGSTAETVGRWTELNDPRVTPLGRLLRRTHFDELPQVLNILRGDLAVVGPRPEQPGYVEQLRTELPFYDLRHLVRPGLTGWAQVKYGYAGSERDALEKLQYEFFYLQHQDLRFDLRVILRTLRSLAGGQGRGR